jgi:hypothetical protein
LCRSIGRLLRAGALFRAFQTFVLLYNAGFVANADTIREHSP